MWSPSWISGFRLLTRDYHLYNTEGISSTHKYGCSRWNFVPNYCRTDRRCCMLYAVRKLYLLPPVLSQHIGYLVDTRLVMSSPSCSPVIFRKSHQSVSANSKRLKNGGSKCWSGVFFTLPTPPTQPVLCALVGRSRIKVRCTFYRFLYGYCSLYLVIFISAMSLMPTVVLY